jgi:hypothetical protein
LASLLPPRAMASFISRWDNSSIKVPAFLYNL